jgi:hypothetical protein
VIGEKGKIYSPHDYGANYEILGGLQRPNKIEFTQSPGHFNEWVRAIKGGPAAMANFHDYASPLTETVLLGNLAVAAAKSADEPGKKIMWDAKNLKPTNAPEVESVVKTEYRKGYSL